MEGREDSYVVPDPVRMASRVNGLGAIVLRQPNHRVRGVAPSSVCHLLFSSVPCLPVTRRRRSCFTRALHSRNVRILCFRGLTTRTLTSRSIGRRFISHVITRSNCTTNLVRSILGRCLLTVGARSVIGGVFRKIHHRRVSLPRVALRRTTRSAR